jgi:hypothetical protein
MPAQEAGGYSVKGAYPDVGRRGTDQSGAAFDKFAGGLLGEGDRQNLVGARAALFDKPGDPVD